MNNIPMCYVGNLVDLSVSSVLVDKSIQVHGCMVVASSLENGNLSGSNKQ